MHYSIMYLHDILFKTLKIRLRLWFGPTPRAPPPRLALVACHWLPPRQRRAVAAYDPTKLTQTVGLFVEY
jgi:hypothetical protein